MRSPGAWRRALLTLGAVPFLLSLDAQWWKYDDFALIEKFRAGSLGRLLETIMATATGTHVRWAFLESILILPWYRWWFDSRAAVNAFYLLNVAALLWAGWALARPLTERFAAWAGAWILFLAGLLSFNCWNTLEFKIACYMPLAIASLVALWRFSRADEPDAPPVPAWRWLALSIAALHLAEANLFFVAPLALALVLRRRLKPAFAAAATAWPFAYWAANRLIFPRPLGLLGEGNPDVLAPALRWALHHATHAWGPELLVLLAAVALCAWASMGRGAPPPLGARCAAALEALAFPMAGAGLLVLTQMNSAAAGLPGYMSERHALYVQLAWTAGALVLVARLARGDSRRASALAAAGLLVAGSALLAQRVPAFFRTVEARRTELAATDQLRRFVQARADEMAVRGDEREILVFVTAWPVAVPGQREIDTTFLGAGWSRDSFARLYACSSPRAACPKVSYLPNTGWSRTTLAPRERGALCARLRRAASFLVSGPPYSPREIALPADGLGGCLRWLDAAQAVDHAEVAAR